MLRVAEYIAFSLRWPRFGVLGAPTIQRTPLSCLALAPKACSPFETRGEIPSLHLSVSLLVSNIPPDTRVLSSESDTLCLRGRNELFRIESDFSVDHQVCFPCVPEFVFMGIVKVCARQWQPPSGGGSALADHHGATEKAETSDRVVSFGIIADPQLGMLKKNAEWAEEIGRLRCGLDAIKRQNPAFIIVLGDLVQAFPEDEGNRLNREREISDIRQTLQSFSGDVPVLIVAGNHDVGNAPTEQNLDDFRALWGDDYYSFDLGHARGIVLNSCLFFNPANAPGEAEAQFVWLKEELETAKEERKPVLLFMHHAFFWSDWNEADDIGIIHIRPLNLDTPKSHFHLPRAQRDRLRSLLRNSTVSHSFHGHLHDNMVVHASDPGLEQVVTSATGLPLGDAPAGFRMVHVDARGAVKHEFFALLESHIPEEKCTSVTN
ncbi:Ser/Thr phosphatase family protein [Toxoplasma gondii RUB]|uniref:Ser/Thr phosphatase family protein n=1 Tax=Toxoplasma gondii RUB TaxID=935652 RepID=A0A086LX40_TOXGO|nr:Ser/Thr phosphatase family protein [Toxoplasma gondii RUB]